MKKLIFGIIILTSLIVGVGINLIYQRSVIGEMTDIISEMTDTPSPANASSSDRLNEIWEKNSRIFSFTTHVEELDNVERSLMKLSVLANDGDALLYRTALGETKISLEAIKNGDDYTLYGIF